MEGVFKFWQNVEQRAKSLMPPQVFPAVVKEVDEDMRTCTVRINDNVDVEDVRLYAVIDDSLKGFCLIPAIDSTVLVGAMDSRQDFYVVMFSEVDKVLGSIGDKTEITIDEKSLSYKCDKTEIAIKSNEVQVKTDGVTFTVSDKNVTIDADKVVFNGGKKGGLININDLAAYIDDIADKFNSHTHSFKSGTIAVEGTAGTMANTAPVISPTPDSTVKKVKASQYEDSTIEH